MKFADFICLKAINVSLKADDSESVVRELAQGLIAAGQLKKSQFKGAVEAILKREKLGSTGMGHGVAIPHTKYAGVKQTTCAVGISQSGVDFASLDGEFTHVFFLLVSPPGAPDNHVRALKKIVELVGNGTFCRFARQANGVTGIEQLFEEADDEGV
jgi:mannitol/fructose-specific phosphotransferase system IIA component (Ntr-type)